MYVCMYNINHRFYYMCVCVCIDSYCISGALPHVDWRQYFISQEIWLIYFMNCYANTYLISMLSCIKETWYTVYSCKYVCVQCYSYYPRRAEELDSDWDIVLLYCVAQNFGRMLPYFDGKALTDLHGSLVLRHWIHQRFVLCCSLLLSHSSSGYCL